MASPNTTDTCSEEEVGEKDFSQEGCSELSEKLENKRRELLKSAEEFPNTTGSEKEVGEIDSDYEEFIEAIFELVESTQGASKELHYVADEIDEHSKNCNRGKIVGSVTSLVGFPLMAAGFGLSFVTFGASLGLSIAGAALSGVGGITAAGSGLAEHFITKDKCRAAQEAVDTVIEKAEIYKERFEKLKEMVQSPGVVAVVRHTGSLSSKAGSGVGIPVVNGIRLAAGVADDAAATVFKGLGTGLRVVHIGGFVLSALLVPYDVYTLATSSVKEHRKTGSPQANKIRELAREMRRFAQEGNAFLDQLIHEDQLHISRVSRIMPCFAKLMPVCCKRQRVLRNSRVHPVTEDAAIAIDVELERERERQKRRQLRKEVVDKLREFVQSAEEASRKLHSLADEIDEVFRKCNRGKIAATAASLLGFPLIAVGFGLSFVTFGASLGLSIAGGAISAAGGITAAGSGVYEHIHTNKKCKGAQEAVDDFHKKLQACKKSLERIEEINEMVPSTSDVSSGGILAVKCGFSACGFVSPVFNGIRLAEGVGEGATATVFRGLATGSRFVHIGGFVISAAILVPIDVVTLVKAGP